MTKIFTDKQKSAETGSYEDQTGETVPGNGSMVQPCTRLVTVN